MDIERIMYKVVRIGNLAGVTNGTDGSHEASFVTPRGTNGGGQHSGAFGS